MLRHALLQRRHPAGLRTVRLASTGRPSPPRPSRPSRHRDRPSFAPPSTQKSGPGPSPASANDAAAAAAKSNKNKNNKNPTIRRVVLTGAFALVTIAGAITGARLKMDSDAVKQQKAYTETPIEDRIAMLEDRRAGLVALKIPLERKLAGLHGRMAAAAAEQGEQEQEQKEHAGRKP